MAQAKRGAREHRKPGTQTEPLSDLGQGSDFKKCVCWGGGVPTCPTACVQSENDLEEAAPLCHLSSGLGWGELRSTGGADTFVY